MKKKNQPTSTVEKISRMNFTGNIIPHSWYENIRTEAGKVDLAGCVILADIVYWYTWSEEKDEYTGDVSYYRKFYADKLQRGYQQQADMMGLTKEQARDAMQRLCESGLIIITVQHGVRFAGGTIGNGVVYVEPIPEAIAKITYRKMVKDVGREISLPDPMNLSGHVGEDVGGNTETSTEISTDSSPEDVTWDSLKSASKEPTKISPEKLAFNKIKAILPFGEPTKDEKKKITSYVKADPELKALESALGDLAMWGGDKSYVDANMALKFWAGKLNVLSLKTPISPSTAYVPHYVDTSPFVITET